MPSSPRGSQPEDRSGSSKGKPNANNRGVGDVTPPPAASVGLAGHQRTGSENAIFMQQSITPAWKNSNSAERMPLINSPGPGNGYVYNGYGGTAGGGTEKRNSTGSMNSQQSTRFLVPAVTSLKQEPFKLVRYDPQEITSYRWFGHIGTSIFVSWSVWKNMVLVIGIAFGTAIVSFLCIPDPKSIDMDRMQDIANFFRVFIAFMLGLFVSSSYSRYQTLIMEYLSLFTWCKSTQSELMNMGISESERKTIERYSVLSTRLLHTELKYVCESIEYRWDDWMERLTNLEERGFLMADERRHMTEALTMAGFNKRKGKKDVDLASLCWVWIGSLLAKLATEGEIPGMQTPTYNALMTGSKKNAQACILKAKGCLSVQMPFPYSHMLATLVHVNNYILAVMSGITMGTAIGMIVHAFEIHDWGSMAKPVQLISTQMIVVMVIPFFYQTFLQIAALMCSPISNEEFPLPVEQLIERLETQLLQQAKFSENPPHWNKPSWRTFSARQAKP